MIRKMLAVTGAAIVLAGGVGAGVAFADDTTSFTNTIHVTNGMDTGHHGPWATLEFDRTVTITQTEPDTYQATMVDDGSFVAIAGDDNSPRDGHAVNNGKGTFHGEYEFTVHSTNGGPNTDGVPAEQVIDEACTVVSGDRHCDHRPPTESYVKDFYFNGVDGVTSSAGDYTWTYKQGVDVNNDVCEAWVDSSNNGDGASSEQDITMKQCATPTSANSFTVTNVCRVYVTSPKGYVNTKVNIWSVKNNTNKPQRFHSGVVYGDHVAWFGWDNRGPLAPGDSMTVASPFGGKMEVLLSPRPAKDTPAVGNSDHTVKCG